MYNGVRNRTVFKNEMLVLKQFSDSPVLLVSFAIDTV